MPASTVYSNTDGLENEASDGLTTSTSNYIERSPLENETATKRQDFPTFDEWVRNVHTKIKKPPGLDDLVKGAADTFAVIGPWILATPRSETPEVVSIVSNLKDQSKDYVKAIAMSVSVAEIGCQFADQGLRAATVMKDNTAIPKDHLVQYVAQMLKNADQAAEQAASMSKAFKQIRIKLIQIQGEIPVTLENIILNMPPPVPKNSIYQVLEATNKTLRLNQENDRSMTRDDVVHLLKQVTHDIAALVDGGITEFVDWWTNLKMDLLSLKDSIEMVTVEQENILRNLVIHSTWLELKNAYSGYKSRLDLLQDCHTQLLTSASRETDVNATQVSASYAAPLSTLKTEGIVGNGANATEKLENSPEEKCGCGCFSCCLIM